MFSAHKKIAAVVLSLSFFSITPLVYADEPETPVEPTPETATIAIRDGATLLGPFTVTLPDVASTTELTATGSSETHAIPARSVLALVHALDAENADFEITDLQYFSSFSSFIVNCISIPAASASPECFNWTYAVDGAFPFFGMDSYVVENGDAVYLFFGSQWQITTDKTEVETNETFTVTAETYDPVSGTYLPAEGQTAGAVQFDSFFMATEFATSTTDALGQALLSLSATGTYSVGVSASGYFPNVSITVIEPAPVETEEAAPSSGGGGGGGVTHISFNTPLALSFLASQQKEDGSFSSSLITDWTAIAYGAVDGGAAEARLKAYLQSARPSLSSVTDYERHAMALLALGIDPYTGAGVDYIAPIVAAFDGTQVGSTSLVNDDIFAVFPLLKSGYTANDSMMQAIATFVVSKQKSNGSWEDSVDVTAAGIQALSLLPNTSDARTKAAAYLRSKQTSTGSFGDVFATSWTLQAIAALGESQAQWPSSGGLYPEDYLATEQKTDGAPLSESQSADMRAWATAYAIPGAEERTWDSILSSFSKPQSALGGVSSGQVLGASTTTEPVATTTTSVTATTTPALPEEPTEPEEEEVTPPVEEKKVIATKPKTTPVPVTATTSEKKATTSTQTASAAGSGWSTFTSFFKSLWGGLKSFFK